MSTVTFKLRKEGNRVILSAYKTVNVSMLHTNLISFRSDGRVDRHMGIDRAFGFDLDADGRLNIHGQ